jgi:hypothetical protein
MYINGTRVATQTDSTNYSNTPLSTTIGNRYTNTGADQYVKGYLSNMSVVNGTARYDPTQSSITVPTSPLTTTANTKLLTCQSSTFIDNSTNNYTIAVSGNSKPSTFSPFTVTYLTQQSYTPSVYGGSMYFDGTGDYAYFTGSPGTTLSGDFTIEAWVYPINFSAGRSILCIGDSFSNPGAMFYLASDGKLGIAYANARNFTGSTVATINAWNHVAFVRSGSTITGYLNGASQGTLSTSNTFSGTTSYIGAELYNGGIGGVIMYGYLSDLSITKAAKYTSVFVPSNAPLTAINNTSLLVNGASAGIYDSSIMNDIETVGDAKVNTALTKFSGGSSVYFDGTGDYLIVNPTNNLEFGLADFTIEFWLYRIGTGRMALYHGSFGVDWSIGIDISSVTPNTSNTIGIWASSNGSSWNLINADAGGNGIGTIAVSQNTWTHIAFVRSGTTWMSFVNGVRDRNITGVSGSIVNRAAYPKAIAAWFGAGAMTLLNGYISDFRVTKGYARYTSNFTVPSSAFNTK